VVGPAPVSYRQMLATYRQMMGLAAPVFIPIPMPLMKLTAQLATLLPQNVLTPDTMRMLERDNIADPAGFSQLLGKTPMSSDSWLSGLPAEIVAAAAVSSWFKPVCQIILSLIWLLTALVSLLIYPISDSLELIASLGITGNFALITLYAAAGLDLAFGIACIVRPVRRLWLAQIVIISIYTGLIGIALPDYLIHPFGPVLKNLAVLALCLFLYGSSKADQ